MRVLVVAPHADDELLGCGGTLLRRKAQGAVLGWVLATSMTQESGWDPQRIESRSQEVQRVRVGLGVASEHLYELGFPPTRLAEIAMREMVGRFSEVFSDFQPEEVFLPHAHDVHSDHRVVFDAASACTKWFRYPSVKRVLTYETLSETDFVLRQEDQFAPNCYEDISPYLDAKLALMRCYASELGAHPFPRSEVSLRALAQLRGAQAGFQHAEAFQLLRERV